MPYVFNGRPPIKSLESALPKFEDMKKVFKYVLIVLGILLLTFGANFFIVKKLDQQAVDSVDFIKHEEYGEKTYLVPSKFIDSGRFYVKLPIKNNDTLLGFCDTGGGLSMLMPNAVSNPIVEKKIRTGLLKGIMPFKYIRLSDILNDVDFPKPVPMRNFVLRSPFSRIKDPYLIIPPTDKEIQVIEEKMPLMKAFLGQGFFMDKAWTFDYLNQKIIFNTPLDKSQLNDPNVQNLGFKKNSHGISIYGHPSTKIEVDGETIDVLFDTGATFMLSDQGQKLLNTTEKTIAGSFVASTIFDRWRKDHPDWDYYPKSDGNRDIIKVPIVKIGEHEVGPVLFAERPDKNWSEGMVHSMDKVVKGAIGGTLLKHFKVTIDYNSELIKFER